MNRFHFSRRSERNLIGVHPDLVKVARRALQLTEVDFTVIEGRRTRSRQRELVASGASQTMNSRHLTGHAIDIAPYIGGTMKVAAEELGVPIEWGGDWTSFKDGPHFQLP